MGTNARWTIGIWAVAAAIGGCADAAHPPGNMAESADGGGADAAAVPPWEVPLQPPGRPPGDCAKQGRDGGARPADAGGPPDAAAADAHTASDAGDVRDGSPGLEGTGPVLAELDYDQPGSDTAELIEIHNAGSVAVPFEGWSLVLINGSGGAPYERIALTGEVPPGGRLVVGPEALAVADGAAHVVAPEGFVQNGPDGVVLLDPENRMVDAVAYEGPVTWVAATDGGTGTPLPEAGAEDPGAGALVRTADGWRLAATPTPGAPPSD